MSFGLALCFSIVLLLFLNDVAEEKGVLVSQRSIEPALRESHDEKVTSDLTSDLKSEGEERRAWYFRPPMIITYAVLLRVIAKGSVMRFLPVYFAQVFEMSPTTLTFVVLIAQVISVFSPMACNALSRAIGRAQTMVLVRIVEPLSFLIFAVVPDEIAAAATYVAFLGVPVGTRAIEKAVLMDYVAPKSRARWSAVETVNRGTWAGSAALGSYLVTSHGFPCAFGVASGFVSVSIMVLASLISFGNV
eukprot:CAMPEP_0185796196 /NCGR_PEP_ID=MMETSP1174-20130828/160950_1 /TAXON_ID=35687 /ORGANISM="Dictyocha speculum, Strain CCMP1381" /LENGTH=246 /DNA_ID=CAMNT_0028491539 /DNA_START=541 /DNA_END=1281 /DNA_ORIENTATION=-